MSRSYIDCLECPHCKPKSGYWHGVRYGICDNSGNVVYLEPRREKRIYGSGYIHYLVSSCGLYESVEDALKKMTHAAIRQWKERKEKGEHDYESDRRTQEVTADYSKFRTSER